MSHHDKQPMTDDKRKPMDDKRKPMDDKQKPMAENKDKQQREQMPKEPTHTPDERSDKDSIGRPVQLDRERQ